MAVFSVRESLWNSLSDAEKENVEAHLRKSGKLADGDEITTLDDGQFNHPPLDFETKQRCPDYCNKSAQFAYDACMIGGGFQAACAREAEEVYMQCCATADSD